MPAETGPDRISRYELTGVIARGGMGQLYLARDPNTSRLVVLKLLDATFDSADLRDRFDREARSLASLSHPNIVNIYDSGDFRGQPFIVMEYVRGETLEERIRRRAPMPTRDKIRLMVELCSGLAHAHDAGIIHRDIKPANLMVDQDDHLKILDFGIARVADSNLTFVAGPSGLMPMQIGTPGYMSPEQTQGGEIDGRTDLFAAGAVCYELLSYREAFPGANRREIERQVMRTPPEPLASIVPGLDRDTSEVVARALAKDRTDRWESARAFGDALEACLVRLGPPSTPPATRRPTPAAAHVGGPSTSRAGGAYARALAAYEGNAPDVARRFAFEALAEDPTHAGALALRARLDPKRAAASNPPVRPVVAAPPSRPAPAFTSTPTDGASMPRDKRGPRDPEVVSIDPALLVGQGDDPATADLIEPTVVITRHPAARSVQTDSTVVLPPPRPRNRPEPERARDRTSEPTARIRPPVSQPKPKPAPSRARTPFLVRMKETMAGAGGGWSPGARGAALVIGALLITALGAFLVMKIGMGFVKTGQLLTVTKPIGGTITGTGIECGTKGSDCSIRVSRVEMVELSATPDAGYQLTGYTGDCAPTGRLYMNQARTCGATFEPVPLNAPPASWTLTISQPTGGTIYATGDIECGTLGNRCSASLPQGMLAKLEAQPESGFKFLRFVGEDCGAGGETLMTAARTCGAVFEQVTVPPSQPPPTQVRVKPGPPPPLPDPPPGPVGPPNRGTPGQVTTGGNPNQGTGGGNQTQPPQARGGVTTPAPPPADEGPVQVSPSGRGEPPAPLITAEKHAEQDIEALVNDYCAAMTSRKYAAVVKLFPLAPARLARDFDQYQDLRCTVAGPLKFELLDAKPKGTARIVVPIKQAIKMKVGSSQPPQELIVTIRMSRKNGESGWLIDNVDAVPKPKD